MNVQVVLRINELGYKPFKHGFLQDILYLLVPNFSSTFLFFFLVRKYVEKIKDKPERVRFLLLFKTYYIPTIESMSLKDYFNYKSNGSINLLV